VTAATALDKQIESYRQMTASSAWPLRWSCTNCPATSREGIRRQHPTPTLLKSNACFAAGSNLPRRMNERELLVIVYAG